jgi:hypothetical protein
MCGCGILFLKFSRALLSVMIAPMRGGPWVVEFWGLMGVFGHSVLLMMSISTRCLHFAKSISILMAIRKLGMRRYTRIRCMIVG